MAAQFMGVEIKADLFKIPLIFYDNDVTANKSAVKMFQNFRKPATLMQLVRYIDHTQIIFNPQKLVN